MKAFIQLWKARNTEFYRDRGSLSWAFVFPVLIIIGCAIAFSHEDETLFTIGFYPNAEHAENFSVLTAGYSKIINYDDLEKAKLRLRNHQLHAVIETATGTVWLNPTSTQSKLIRHLLEPQAEQLHLQELSGKAIRYVDWVIPGVLGMNIMFGSLFGVGYVMVRYRKNGVLKRLQATPISAYKFLSAQIASRLFVVLSTNSMIFIGSYFALDLMMLGNALSLLVVAAIGAMSMISIGLLIASRTDSEEFAGGILNAATWPMMFLSGIWFSLDDTPELMQALANLLPLTHLVAAARDIMINGASLVDEASHLLVLLAVTLISLSLAALSFRWHK